MKQAAAMPIRRAGFWLIELLFVLGLLGIVAILATKLFTATIRLGQDATQAQNHAATLDSISAVLRSDLWAAAKFEVAADGRRATIAGGKEEVTWSIDGETMTRLEKDSPTPRRWSIAKETTFDADGAMLVLRLPAGGGEARFVRQTQILARLWP
jgi:type II secretory pathway pseudopilin PulG